LYNGFENFALQVAEINGGSLRNAIPRESSAKIVVAENATVLNPILFG
jgi:dipeptidase D